MAPVLMLCAVRAGPCKTVEFDFDLGADTAMSVASEMVEDLSLSHEDAQVSRGVQPWGTAVGYTCSPPAPFATRRGLHGHAVAALQLEPWQGYSSQS